MNINQYNLIFAPLIFNNLFSKLKNNIFLMKIKKNLLKLFGEILNSLLFKSEWLN